MAAQVFEFDAPLPARVYWDASFLVHATYPAGRYHSACYALLERLSDAQEAASYVSTLALDEAIFVLIQLKIVEDHPGRAFWDVYRENPQAIQPYVGELRELVDHLSAHPRIQVVGTAPESMSLALDYMERYALLPRDALHLTIMAHHDVEGMVTTDEDFFRVDKLRIFTCNTSLLARR
jgi:predicted nucleic acid-binding protein